MSTAADPLILNNIVQKKARLSPAIRGQHCDRNPSAAKNTIPQIGDSKDVIHSGPVRTSQDDSVERLPLLMHTRDCHRKINNFFVSVKLPARSRQ